MSTVRSSIRLFVVLLAACALIPAAAGAAPNDPTSTAVVCSPDTVATASATTCTATVTDTASSPTTPGASVSFDAAPTGGAFSASMCSLAPTDTAGVASCAVSFTPATGGDYTVTGSYAGDSTHTASNGSDGTIVVSDPTSTAVSCAPTQVVLGESTTCTATVTDPDGTEYYTGAAAFSVSPSVSAFGPMNPCQFTTGTSSSTLTCQITFTPPSTGAFTISAAFSGDTYHGASSASTTVSGVAVPASDVSSTTPGGSGNGSGGDSTGAGTTTAATTSVTVNPQGYAVVAGEGRIELTCTGTVGVTCAGSVSLSAKVTTAVKKTTTKVKKKKTKTKVKKKAKTKKKTKKTTGAKVAQAAKKAPPKAKTIVIGSAQYSMYSAGTDTVELTLSKAFLTLLAAAPHQRLAVTVTVAQAGGPTVTQPITMTLLKVKATAKPVKKPVVKKKPTKKKPTKKKPVKKKPTTKTKAG